MRLIKLTIVIILGIFVLTACGRGGDTQIMRNPQELISGTTQEVSSEETTNQNMAGDDLYTPTATQSGGTIRVLAPTHFRTMLEAASLEFSRTQGVELDITFFNPAGSVDYLAGRLPQAIADGEFDLFFADPRFPLFEMTQDGLLSDIFDLMGSCPHFIPHDFYLEALQTLTVGHRLYFFPLNFGFQYAAINTRWIPQYFVDRFNSYETITVSQMVDIYLDITRSHTILLIKQFDDTGTVILNMDAVLEPTPGPISLDIANCRDLLFPEYMLWNAIMDYVDLNTMTSNLLDESFVTFLQNMLELFPLAEANSEMQSTYTIRHNVIPRHGYHPQLGRIYLPIWLHNDLNWEDTRFAFVIHNQFLNPVSALVPFRPDIGHRPPSFNHFIPLVDEMGRRRTNIGTSFPWHTLSIANNYNADTAWNFIARYLIPSSICPEINEITVTMAIPSGTPSMASRLNSGLHTVNSPIERSAAAAHLPYIFTLPKEFRDVWCTARDTWIPGVPLEGIQEAMPEVQEQTIARVVAQLEAMNEMPMAPIPLIPIELFEPALQNMLRRFTSPEATAQIIHDNVVRWMGN